ncbi:hypothetical protein F5Y16DRAFT_416607 [Xylariaceae sp. FL0255]|nr:hypothetical protein F5Y16DRAFT_416607 [Xylariaceae sp. FL0255]
MTTTKLTHAARNDSPNYALTTTFTPPPECLMPVLFGCVNSTICGGATFAGLQVHSALDGESSGEPTTIACLPSTYGDDEAVYIYSPGIYCPSGMTTANIDGFGNTALGCQFVSANSAFPRECDFCSGQMSTGVFLQGTNTEELFIITGTMTATSDILGNLPVRAFPVIIEGGESGSPASQSTPTTEDNSSLPTPSSSPAIKISNASSQSPAPTSSSQSSSGGGSKGTKLRVVVGAVVATVLLLLAAVLVSSIIIRRRRRKRCTIHAAPGQQSPRSGEKTRIGNEVPKPLEFKHYELDASAGRAELEGTPVATEDVSSGIYVVKSELEGTAGVPGLRGVYVKKKAELDGRSPAGGRLRQNDMKRGDPFTLATG